MDESIDIDEAKKLVSGIWGQQLKQVAWDCVAPFFWVEPQSDGRSVVGNGTVFFLDTGARKFAVTAYHVYEGFLAAAARNQETVCQIHNEKFDPRKNIIDFSLSSNLDLITFEISEDFVSKIGKRFFMGHQDQWPPLPPEENKGVFFVGYPGIERVIVDNQKIIWGAFGGICVAHSVSENHISVQHEAEYAVEMPDSVPVDYNTAGISGAPLITLVGSKGTGMNYWRLGGVIFEAFPDSGILYARRADYLLENGLIKHS